MLSEGALTCDSSNPATADLRLRPHDHRGLLAPCLGIQTFRSVSQKAQFCLSEFHAINLTNTQLPTVDIPVTVTMRFEVSTAEHSTCKSFHF